MDANKFIFTTPRPGKHVIKLESWGHEHGVTVPLATAAALMSFGSGPCRHKSLGLG